MNESEIARARNIVWDYLQLHGDFPDTVDVMVVLGSRDDRVAEYAADISHRVSTSVIVVTGGAAHKDDLLARPKWPEKSEAEHFAAVMERHQYKGTLELETKAANTGEKAKLTEKLLRDKQLEPYSMLLVTKPYMERRALKTFEKFWTYGSPKFYTTSTRQTFDEYVDHEQTADVVTNIMVGDLERIIAYPAKGFMNPSTVPEFVIDALKTLKDADFTKHSLK